VTGRHSRHALALGLALAGCAAPQAVAPDDPALTERGISAAPIELRLIGAGQAPRQPLRYQVAAGATETVVVELADTMKLAVGDMAPPEVRGPPLRLTLSLRARAVDPNGRITIAATIAKVEVPAAPPVPAGVTGAVASELEGLSGATFSALVSGRGYLERLALDTPEGASPQLATAVERLRQSLRHLWPPLPDEPVGPGAAWGARWKSSIGPAAVDERVEYTLSARQSGKLLLAIKLTLSAAAQTVVVPGMPPGASLTLDALSGTGAGKAEVQLSHLAQSGELRWSANATGSSRPAGDPAAPVRLDTTTALTMRPR
jgi:hypothetical protein